MFNYVEVEINRSETTVLHVAVVPWEFPLLEAVNGSDRCRIVGQRPSTRNLPEPSSEYARLTSKYGPDSDTGRDFVELVYGSGQRGVETLAKEIAKVAAVPLAAAPKSESLSDADVKFLREQGLLDDAPAGTLGVVAISE